MSALDLIRRVRSMGGELYLEEGRLKVKAPDPLPPAVMTALSECKPAIMVALGASLDTVVGSVLRDFRPYLPPSLRQLSDDRLLVLVNWSIIAAWRRALDSFPWAGRPGVPHVP